MAITWKDVEKIFRSEKKKIGNPCKCACDKKIVELIGKEPELSKASLLAARKEMAKFKDDIEIRLNGADSRMIGSSKYKEMEIEPWKIMKSLSKFEFFGDPFISYLWLAAIKHLLRAGKKSHTSFKEDMQKAEHILQRLIEEL